MRKKKTPRTISFDLPTDPADVDLFLAFPDGVYHYVCAECTAICCKGHGLSATKAEMPVLLTRYPATGSLAHGRSGSVITLSTLTNACVFLDTDELCRIEKDLGRAAKPSLCKLFPFNAYKRIGRTIAVYPHFLCPFRLQIPARPGKVEGTHALIDPAFRFSGLLEPAYVSANVSSAPLHPSLDADQVIARERAFLKRCARGLGKKTLFDVLREASTDPGSLSSFVSRALKVLALPRQRRSVKPDRIDDIMIALAVPLRLQMLTLSSEGILRALALSELVIRRVATLPVEPIAPHAVYSFLGEHMPGIRFIARGVEPLVIPPGVNLNAPPIGDPGLTFSSFVFIRELRDSANVLRSFEKAVPASMTTADRSTFLQMMGRMLDHTHVHTANSEPPKEEEPAHLDSHSN